MQFSEKNNFQTDHHCPTFDMSSAHSMTDSFLTSETPFDSTDLSSTACVFPPFIFESAFFFVNYNKRLSINC